MRKLLFTILALSLFSCNKISQLDLQGSWIVDSIQQQEITANMDSGWKSEMAASSIFFVGESLTFNKSSIIPCPSAASMVKDYDDYPGYVAYSLSGHTLVIPEQNYSYYRIDSNGDASAGQITFRALEFEVDIVDNEMDLTGKFEETDNLGNVKRRVNVRIDLSRTK